MRYHFWLVILSFIWALPLYAGPKEEAANKRKEAERLFTQGDYNQALLAYDEAHAIFADPSDWLGRAQVLIKLRRFTEANEAYQKFLSLGKAGKKQRDIERAMEDLSIILQTKISCSSTPAGATVYLNSRVDDPLGQTPLESNIPPGTHRLIFEKEGFETLVQTVTIEPGVSQTSNAELRPALALLSVQSSPSSAQITINGEVQGMTPLEVRLPNGVYELEASAEGYPTQRKRMEAQEQQTYSWSLDLTQPPPGILSAQLTPTTAVATINGEVLKQSEALSLRPGTYQASITAEGYKTQQQEVIIESGQEHTLKVQLETKGVLLQAKANRPGYQLSLDGVPLLLDATQKAVLSGGTHQLIANAPRASPTQAEITSSGGTVLAQIEFKDKPRLTTKLALAGGVGFGGASVLLATGGLTRLVKINQFCSDQLGANNTNCALAFQTLEPQRRQFFIAAEVSLIAALASGTYWWYKKRSEGSSSIQLLTQER
jgi:hypothetical protein